MINIEEVKKKFFIPSDLKIAICSVEEIREMVLTLERQQQQLEDAHSDLKIANELIKVIKTKSRFQKYLDLEKENLAMAQELALYKEMVGGVAGGSPLQHCQSAGTKS